MILDLSTTRLLIVIARINRVMTIMGERQTIKPESIML